MEPYTGSPGIFFGTIVVVMLGAFVPLLFGKETVGPSDRLIGIARLAPSPT